MKTKARIVNEWISGLRALGIKRFYFNELPENLRSRKYLYKAIQVGAIHSIDGGYGKRKKWEL